MWRAIALCAFCATASAQHATVDELVGESVFGVKWTDAFAAVRAKHPDDKLMRYDTTTSWVVSDARFVFEVERRRRDTIEFAFLGDALVGVTVTFPSCANTVSAMPKFLGPIDSAGNVSQSIQDSAVLGVNLPADVAGWTGSKVTVRAALNGLDCMVTIGPKAIAPVEGTREQLGLE